MNITEEKKRKKIEDFLKTTDKRRKEKEMKMKTRKEKT